MFYFAYCIFSLMGAHYGTGQHTVDILPENLPIALRDWWMCEPIVRSRPPPFAGCFPTDKLPQYVLSQMALKLSIAIFLLRICVVRMHKMIIYTVLIVTEVYGLFFFFLFVLQCRPSKHFWDQFAPVPGKGTCINPSITTNAFYAYSAIGCVTDWVFSLLPIGIVWRYVYGGSRVLGAEWSEET